MKVQSTNQGNTSSLRGGTSVARQSGGNAPAAGTTTPGADAPGSSDVNVSLSGLSAQLNALAASGDADIDTSAVESIKTAIRNGTLQIDPSKIADGVLETARSLLQTQTPSS